MKEIYERDNQNPHIKHYNSEGNWHEENIYDCCVLCGAMEYDEEGNPININEGGDIR